MFYRCKTHTNTALAIFIQSNIHVTCTAHRVRTWAFANSAAWTARAVSKGVASCLENRCVREMSSMTDTHARRQRPRRPRQDTQKTTHRDRRHLSSGKRFKRESCRPNLNHFLRRKLTWEKGNFTKARNIIISDNQHSSLAVRDWTFQPNLLIQIQ